MIEMSFRLIEIYLKIEDRMEVIVIEIIKLYIIMEKSALRKSKLNPQEEELDSAAIIFEEVRQQIRKSQQTELFFRAFLRPIEITLKTVITEGDPTKLGALPYGLKQVCKASVEDNTFTLLNFYSIRDSLANLSGISKVPKSNGEEIKLSLKTIQDLNCDNLISIMKSTRQDFRLKLAICVCVQNQTKSMLKQTLTSINKNIQTFVKKGISYNDIGVFVFINGIQTVHPSIQDYFQQLEKQCNVFLAEIHDNINKKQIIEDEQADQEIEGKNFNHLIFDKAQLRDFKKRRFCQRRRKYKFYKQMIADVETIEKQKQFVYQNMNSIVKKFFIKQIKEQYKQDFSFTETEITWAHLREIVNYYTDSFKKSDPLMRIALQKAKKYLKQYIETRVTKYKNRENLSSHNWFFNGFCQQLNPEFSILLDAGVVCEKKSLWKMFTYMSQRKNIGGVSGYMKLRYEKLEEVTSELALGPVSLILLNFFSVQRAQQFENHFTHLVSKPFQSFFNFVQILPSAFSGYRMEALRKENQVEDSTILKNYFGSMQSSAEIVNYQRYPYSAWQTIWKIVLPEWLGWIYNCFYGKLAEDSYEKLMYDKNVYLAGDRILSMGLHQNGYDTAFLLDAEAQADPVKNLEEFLGQRRKQSTGSYFSSEKIKQESLIGCEWLLKFQLFYLSLLDMITFITPGLLFYISHITMKQIQIIAIEPLLFRLGLFNCQINNQNGVLSLLVPLMDFIYVMLTMGLLLNGIVLNNRNSHLKTAYYTTAVFYGFYSYAFLALLILNFFDVSLGPFNCTSHSYCIQQLTDTPTYNNLLWILNISIAGVCFLYIIPLIALTIFNKFNHLSQIILSAPSFIFYFQTFLNTSSIYSLCKIDDIPNCARTSDEDFVNSSKIMLEDWKRIKFMHVFRFMLYNMVVGTVLMIIDGLKEICNYKIWVLIGIVGFIGFTLLLRVVFGIVYMFVYRIQSKIDKNWQGKDIKIQKQNKEAKKTASSSDSSNQISNNSNQIQNIDLITQKFDTVKQSIYQSIRTKIIQIKQQLNESNKPHLLSQIINSPKLYNETLRKINTEYQNKQKFIQYREEVRYINQRNLQNNWKMIRNDKLRQEQSQKSEKISWGDSYSGSSKSIL